MEDEMMESIEKAPTLPRWATQAGEMWRHLDVDVRWVAAVGLVLTASGLAHVGVWALDGFGQWAGPVSWRKAIVFGLSGGVTSLSLAWVMTQLPRTRLRRRLGAVFAWAMGVEVFLITMQRWRGVASHFNDATLIDGAVFSLMGLLITVVVIVTVVWTVQAFRQQALPADVALAMRAGLMLLLAAHLLGYAILAHAEVAMAANPSADPTVLGAAGLMKLPHGLALHGLQTLPILLWLLRRSGAGLHRRLRLLRFAAAGHGLVVAFGVVQMLSGRAPTDVSALAMALLVCGLSMLALPYAVAIMPRLWPTRALATAAPGGTTGETP
jgi:hypothetical protein